MASAVPLIVAVMQANQRNAIVGVGGGYPPPPEPGPKVIAVILLVVALMVIGVSAIITTLAYLAGVR